MAEGNSRVEETLLARALMAIVRLAIWSPGLTVGLALLGIAGSLYLCTTRLGYHPSRAALLDKRQDYQRRWLKYVEQFGEQEDVVVVVQGDRREAIVPALDELVRRLQARPESFRAVLHEIDLTRLRDKGLYYLNPEELRTIEGFLNDVEPIIRGGWDKLAPGTLASGMCAQLQAAQPEQLQQAIMAAQGRMAKIADGLLTALSEPGAYKSPWPDMSDSARPLMGMTSYRLISGDGRAGFVLLKLPKDTSQSMLQNAPEIESLRGLIEGVKSRYPGVTVGLTGLPVMEYDEMRCSQSSMSVATLLSFAGVLLVLIAGFGGVRHSVLTVASLLVGLILALGYTTLAVGHLNILSSAFGAVLTGLGINYSIYFVARFMELRRRRVGVRESLWRTAGSVGPGITVSALSSAIAFFMAGLTGFTGVAELGLIAGGGIVLCFAVAMIVLPAILLWSDGGRPGETLPRPLDFQLWIQPLAARPYLVLFVALAGTAAAAFGMTRLTYDYNLLHLQAAGLESVELEQRLLNETRQSAYYALSMVRTPEEAAARKARFLQLPTVERVDDIVTQLPSGMAEKRPIIERIGGRLAGLPQQPPQIPVASQYELGRMLSALQPLMATNLQMADFQRQLQDIQSLLGRLPPAEYRARLSQYQQRVAADLLGRLHLLRSAADPRPPQLADLPAALVSRFVGRSGTHLLKIYVKGDFWDIANLEHFVNDVRGIDADATGNPLQIYEASRQMRRSYEQAAIYALLAIVPVVLLNFGRMGPTLLSILPLALAMLQTFGMMGLLDIPLNPANMIGLSLLLGMGMENGVLITHDYLGQRTRYRMSPSTGVAVVINTLTTMVGFAVLMLADHRGLQSMGRMLTIGMSCCLFSSMVMLPMLLTILTRHRPEAEQPLGETPPLLPPADEFIAPGEAVEPPRRRAA